MAGAGEADVITRGVPGGVLDMLQVCPSPEVYSEVAMPLLTPPDPSLTLTRTQHPAIVGKAGNNESLTYAGFANPCNPQQPMTAHS
jgi:hypothetical protein